VYKKEPLDKGYTKTMPQEGVPNFRQGIQKQGENI
jgi:hypothetical protein